MRDRRAEFPQLWHVFLQRKMLTVERPLGYVYRAATIQFPPLHDIVASLLFIDLVSLLEIAVRTQMSRDKFDELEDLEQRLAHLASHGKLLDHASLEALRRRRNDIAHDIQLVDLAELNQAIAVVHAQLEAWGLVGPIPPYEFYAERSQARDASDDERAQGYNFAYDYKVGIKQQGQAVIEYTRAELFS